MNIGGHRVLKLPVRSGSDAQQRPGEQEIGCALHAQQAVQLQQQRERAAKRAQLLHSFACLIRRRKLRRCGGSTSDLSTAFGTM